MREYKTNKLILIRVVALFLMAALLIVLPGCSGKEKGPTLVPGSSILPAPNKKPVTDVPTNNKDEIVITGVLSYVDTASKKMRIIDVEETTEYEIPYTGGTDIRNKYDTIIAVANMELGQVYEVTCNKSGTAVKVYGHKDSWERDELTDLEIDEELKTVTIGTKTFKYNDSTLILSGGEKIAFANIVAQDEITMYGIEDKIYSIIVDKSHGYIKFTGIEAFLDGYVTIGRKQLLSVTSGMLITAQEGTHKVELQNGSLVAEKIVNVTKGQETEVDFSEYTLPANKNGAVEFSVNPSTATMTIDGEEVDFSQPVSLPYGRHKLVLEAHNYEPYTANFVVNSSYRTIIIDMISTGSITTQASTEKNLTEGYTVHITEPAGAALYVDSVYIGVIPCSFDKKAGNKTITLTKKGFDTIGYTISIANASGNLTYAFPDMTKSADDNETSSATAATETAAPVTPTAASSKKEDD